MHNVQCVREHCRDPSSARSKASCRRSSASKWALRHKVRAALWSRSQPAGARAEMARLTSSSVNGSASVSSGLRERPSNGGPVWSANSQWGSADRQAPAFVGSAGVQAGLAHVADRLTPWPLIPCPLAPADVPWARAGIWVAEAVCPWRHNLTTTQTERRKWGCHRFPLRALCARCATAIAIRPASAGSPVAFSRFNATTHHLLAILVVDKIASVLMARMLLGTRGCDLP